MKRARLCRELAAAVFAGALAVGVVAVTPMVARASSSQTWSGSGDGTTWGDPQNWASGSVPQNGDSVTIAPTATQPRPAVTMVPGGADLQDLTLTDASLSGGAVTVTGDFTWDVASSSNTLDAPLTVQGTATLSGAGRENSQAPMTFEGTTEIDGPGLLSIQDPGNAITNSGTMTLKPGVVVGATVCCVNPDQFLNTGTISVPASAAKTVSLEFMKFNDQGSVSVGPGSLLDVSGGPGAFKSGVAFSGGGSLQFDQGAAITLASNVHIGAGSTMTLTGNARFLGPGSFAGAGKFSWSGGTIDGSLDIAKTIQTVVSGTGKKTLMSPGATHALLAFHGPTTVQDSGPLEAFAANMSNSGTFTIRPGATVEANECCVSPDVFLNTGTLSVPSSAAGTAELDLMSFRDHGAVSVGAGSTLHVTIGPGDFSPGAGIHGGGTVLFDQGALMSLASNISIAAGTTVQLTGEATFRGNGTFTGTGHFRWTGGTIDGNLAIASTVATIISGTATKSLTSPTSTAVALTLRGATTLAGTGELELSGATTLANLGTFTMGAGTTVGGSVCCVKPDKFTNQGRLLVAAGTKTATVTNMAFSNSGTVKLTSGTLFVNTLSYRQSAGATTLAGGSLSAAMGIDIAGGTLSGFGTITGSVLNNGIVAPSTTGGVLKITGSYKQTTAGKLAIVITGTKPGTKFGQLAVGGHATLAGTLHVSTGSGFTPKHHQAFAILLYHARSGTFTTHSGAPAYTLTYGTTLTKAVFT
jgi:hypothetical protein